MTTKKSSSTNGTNGHEEVHAREQRELVCALSADEQRMRGAELAQQELEIERLKEARKGLNGQIADARAVISKLSQVVDARKETRVVECVWLAHGTNLRLVRSDTREQIDSRAMSAEERQETLFDEPDEPEAPAAEVAPKKRGRPRGSRNKRHAHEATPPAEGAQTAN